MIEQPGLCRTCSETRKTGFLIARLILSIHLCFKAMTAKCRCPKSYDCNGNTKRDHNIHQGLKHEALERSVNTVYLSKGLAQN